jgi:hypothetical protein
MLENKISFDWVGLCSSNGIRDVLSLNLSQHTGYPVVFLSPSKELLQLYLD